MTEKPKMILGVLLLLLLFVVDVMAVPDEKVMVSDVISSHIAVQDRYLIWSEYSDTPIRKIPKYGGSLSTLAHAMGAAMNVIIHDGFIYWINRQGSGQPSDIRTLNKTSLDGATTIALAQGYQYLGEGRENADIVIYEDSVYWVTGGYGVFTINKVPINGGESTAFISTSEPVMSLARDGLDLYYMEPNDGWYYRGAIKKLPIEGGEPVTIYPADQNLLYGVMAVRDGQIVFGDILPPDQLRLMKIPSSGGAATVLCAFTVPPGTDPGPTDKPTRIIIEGNNVYWADQHSVRTIPLGGGEHVVLADNLSYPEDLAVIGGSLFWTEKQFYPSPGSIKKVPLTGGSITTLADSLEAPVRLAMDGSYLYFAENFPNSQHPYNDGRIARISQDGGTIQTLVNGVANITPYWSGVYQTVPFVVDNTNVYFADGCAVKKVPLAGGPVERIGSFPYGIDSIATDGEFVYCLDELTNVWRIPVNGGEQIALYPIYGGISDGPIRVVGDMVYWASDHNTIKKVHKNGGGVVTISSTLPFMSDFVVDGENIYFSGQDTGEISRISVNGGPITTLAYSRSMYWNIMAVDEESVYWITYNAIGKVPKTGGNVTYYSGLSTDLDYPSGIAVDQNDLYWTETGAGTIKKTGLWQTVFRVDFDGDGKTDIAVYRSSNGWWIIVPSSNPSTPYAVGWGASSDIPVPGDYDGDGKTDIAVYRPSNGWWIVVPSSNPSAPYAVAWGVSSDIPVPGDYDGDGKTDIAVYRPSNGWWIIVPSSNPSAPYAKGWGASTDKPVPGDYDGDGKTDIALYRPSNGWWIIVPSSNPSAPYAKGWGASSDIPVPGDYDGDGKTDIAVYRPSNGWWIIVPSSNPSTPYAKGWGASSDIPVPGDYDGDGKTDIAVYRPSNGWWIIFPSSNPSAPYAVGWGGDPSDIPVTTNPALYM